DELMQQERFDCAIAEFTKAVALAPQESSCYVARGHAYLAAGDFAAAEADFTSAIRVNLECWAGYSSRALVYYVTERFTAAIADCDSALEFAGLEPPAAARIYYTRGMALKAMGAVARSLEDFARSEELESGILERSGDGSPRKRPGKFVD